MLTKALKQSLTLALVVAALTGCTSTSTPDVDTASTVDDSSAVSMGTADSTDLSSSMDEEAAMQLDTIFYFEFDKSMLNADARATLTAHAARLQAAPHSVRLEGHADERGTREYNMALGERRAKAVRDFLVLQGVDRNSIETVSYGEEYPAVLGGGESGYSQNRRVELK